MDEKELLRSLSQKVWNLTEDEVASLYEDDKLKEDALTILEQKNAEKIQSIKESHIKELTKKFDDGHKKGKKESLKDWEARIKADFGIESEKEGVELIKEILSKNSKSALTEDQIKAHKVYLDLESNSVPKSKYEELDKTFADYKTTRERAELVNKLYDKGRETLMKMNPALNEDKNKAENQVKLFLSSLINSNSIQDKDGRFLLMDGDKRKEDAHGNAIYWDDYVKTQATAVFDFKKQSEKGNTGNDGEGGTVIVPKSKEEYLQEMAKITGMDEESMKKRIELRKAYRGE